MAHLVLNATQLRGREPCWVLGPSVSNLSCSQALLLVLPTPAQGQGCRRLGPGMGVALRVAGAHAGLQGLSLEGLVASGWPGAGPLGSGAQQGLGLPTGAVPTTIPEPLP